MTKRLAAALTIVLALGVAGVFLAAPAFSGKTKYEGTLTAAPNALHAGDYFTVSGCGYELEYGNVLIGFTGGGWGSPLTPDPANPGTGCFSIPDIPALSGDTLPAGTYPVTAYQYIRGKLTKTGATTVTVLPS